MENIGVGGTRNISDWSPSQSSLPDIRVNESSLKSVIGKAKRPMFDVKAGTVVTC